MIGRRVMLEKGFDTGTANLTFGIILGTCIVGYLVILAILAFFLAPSDKKQLSEINEPIPPVIEDNNDVSNEKEVMLGQPTEEIRQNNEEDTLKKTQEEIRQNTEKLYFEKQTAKVNLFLQYSQLTMFLYITPDEMLQLDEHIRYYARKEPLPEDITTITPTELTTSDLNHFGWNMAHYFGFPKREVVPWLQQVFTELQKLEFSTIYGKLGHTSTEKQIIPIIDDIPKYLAELNL